VAIAQTTRKALDQLQARINPGKESELTAGYLRALVIGCVAGSRSTLPLTLLAWQKDPRQADTLLPSQILDTKAARIIITTASVGEIIADKTPFIPSRLSPPAFIGRLISGGLAGAIMAYRFRESPVLGALLGGGAAGFGAIVGYYSRKTLDEHTPIPDPVWAVVEDAVAVSLGLLAVSETIPLEL
jgi:uncharacterized membrane protein